MGYGLNVNCIYNDNHICQHVDKREQILFVKYKPICDSTIGCKLAKIKYPIPPRPPIAGSGVYNKPTSITITVNAIDADTINGVLNSDRFREELRRVLTNEKHNS